MSGLALSLPTIQNWNCHNCSGCCRKHAIEVTAEERQRIEAQGWGTQDGFPAGQELFVSMGGGRYRLAHQPDGACLFLGDDGLCRIHARHGEQAKPLACRVYPYAFHPSGNGVTVSLRFSCPSVVMNRGQSVAEQSPEIRRIAKAVVPQKRARISAPPISPASQVEWKDFRKFVATLDDMLADNSAGIVCRLLRSMLWVGLLQQSTQLHKLSGSQMDEFVELTAEGAAAQFPGVPPDMAEPSQTGRTQFRLLAAQYARGDTTVDLASGWRGHWRRLRAALQFTRGRGDVPPLQEIYRPVPFESLEVPFGGINGEIDEIFTRYLRVKVQGLHFCGPAYYNVPFVEGYYSLTLVFPAVLWIARWLAAGAGRTQIATEDFAQALAIADHHHGYSPVFGSRSFRRRVKTLVSLGDIAKLCVWYAR